MFLEISEISQENPCARVSFLNEVAGQPLFKTRLWLRRFPMIFAKFLRAPFFTEHLRWLSQSVSQLVSQSVSQPASQPASQPVSQSVSKIIYKLKMKLQSKYVKELNSLILLNSCVNRNFFIPGQVSSRDKISSWVHVNALLNMLKHSPRSFLKESYS